MSNLQSNFLPTDAWKQRALDKAVSGLIARLGAEREEKIAQIILYFDTKSTDSRIPETKKPMV